MWALGEETPMGPIDASDGIPTKRCPKCNANCNPILDSDYKENMGLEDGVELAKRCIFASTKRDPASGEGLDIFTITKDGIKQVAKQKAEAVYTEQKD